MLVTLVDFPAALFHAFDEATEGLLREMLMSAYSGGQPFTAEDIAIAGQAKRIVAEALGSRRGTLDLTLELTPHQAASYAVLQAVLDHANREALSEEFLALPVLPEIAAMRNWMCDEVASQASGGPATPWRMPSYLERPGRPPATWRGMASLPADEAWLVGDDVNRIIGASRAALEMLGWDALVGERLLAVIPHEFRERHVASFSRGVVTGEHRLLDQPLALAALTRDGRTIPVTLTLTRHGAEGERHVYLARLEPR